MLALLGLFLLYSFVRLLAWKETVLLEDTDSLFYIHSIKTFLTFSLHEISNLNPDSTPFYPLFSALCSLPGWSAETGARLCSFLFSLILFIAIFLIARRSKNHLTIVLALIILTFSAPLISLSFSVLTEPSYVATIYLGYWFFLYQYQNPRLWKGALLGVIFALSFLNRTEGILYLLVIPFLQGLHLLFSKNRSYNSKHYMRWTIVFITCFFSLAIPQIYQVSNKMGGLAINGRQAWRLLEHNLEGKSQNEIIFGLDFTPKQINIVYAKENYAALKTKLVSSNTNYMVAIKRFYRNVNTVYRKHLIELIGPFGLILLAFGVLYSYQTGRRFETFIHLLFITFSLIAPLSHSNYVLLRHIVIIVPLIVLFQATGILYLSNSLMESNKRTTKVRVVIPFLILAVLVLESANELKSTFTPPHYNREYSLTELENPIRIVKSTAKDEPINAPVIAAQRGYLAYFVGMKQAYLPFCDYEKLVRWCSLNNVDFLFLKHSRLKNYPWFKLFMKESPPSDFFLIYRGIDIRGKRIELYRFQNDREQNVFSKKLVK